MGFFSRFAGFLRGLNPAQRHKDAAAMAGFLQTSVAPAPDAGPLVETDQISAVVSRCINVISEDCAHIPLNLFRNWGSGMPKKVMEHPAIDLWRHINPVETPTVYLQQLYADLLVEGNHFAWLDIQNGLPVNMIRMPPEQVTVIPHATKIIAGYKWRTPDGKEDSYPADQIVHIRTRNPASIYRGMGYLARLREQILFDRHLRAYKLNQVRNGIPTTVIFNVVRGFGNDEEFERFQEETWQKMRGVKNAGKPFFIRNADVKMEVVPRPTEQEVQILENLKYTRNEVAMMFGVPPSRLSDYGEAFRSSASEQSRTFVQDTVMSWHRLFIDYLNSIFLPRWFPKEARRLHFAYDYSQVRALALSTRDMATVNQILIDKGMRTPNQGAIAIGDAAHDEPAADLLYMNGKPLGAKEPEPQPEPSNDDRPGTQPGEQDPENNDDDGKEPAEAQDDEERVFATKGGDVDLDNLWIASAVLRAEDGNGEDAPRRVFGIASTDAVDRANTIVNQKSLQKAAKNWLKNGKIFYNHNWQIPMGKAIAAEHHEGKMMLGAEIDRDHDIVLSDGFSSVRYPVDDIWKGIKQGSISSYSIAFNAKEVPPEDDGAPIELMVTDLFEVSVVSIGANVEANFSVTRAADNPTFVRMLRGESGSVPDKKAAPAAAHGDGIKFTLDDSEDNVMSKIEEELDRWLTPKRS